MLHKDRRRLTLGIGDTDGHLRMHWHIYLVIAVGMVFVVIVDLTTGRWARAGLSFLLLVFLGLRAWNGREEDRKMHAAEMDASEPDAPRE